MKILLYVAIGLVIGAASGMLGIGGGVLLVPALVWLCDFEYRKAAGTSLAILVPPIGLPAALKAWYDDRVDVEAAVWIAAAFAVGAFLGAALLRYVSPDMLRLGLGLLMVYIAMRFIISSSSEAANAAAGLGAALVAWLGYLGLRWLGRRHLVKPDLAQHIRSRNEAGHGGSEYHI